MKRCRAPVPLEVVEHNGYYYCTIDFVSPSQIIGNCQTSYLALRDGWELAPDQPDILEKVIKPYRWAAHRVALANGKSYYSSAHAAAGTLCGQSELEQGNTMSGARGYRPKRANMGDGRVLIRTLAIDPHTSSSSNDPSVSGMWKRRRFTDFMLVSEGEELPCHREVLASCSAVFDRALDPAQFKEGSSDRYEIKGSNASIVKSMLEFMYTGALPESSSELVDLICLADQYQVEQLVQSCAQRLIREIGPENVVQVTRAIKGFKSKAKFAGLWKEIQNKIREDDQLMELVMDYL